MDFFEKNKNNGASTKLSDGSTGISIKTSHGKEVILILMENRQVFGINSINLFYMDISINFLFPPRTELKNIKNKLINLFKEYCSKHSRIKNIHHASVVSPA